MHLKGAVALDGEVAATQRRATDEGGGHLQVQAAGAEQCRLHDNAGQPLVDRGVGSDEDRRTVGPRRFVRYSGNHLDGTPGDRGCKQSIAP